MGKRKNNEKNKQKAAAQKQKSQSIPSSSGVGTTTPTSNSQQQAFSSSTVNNKESDSGVDVQKDGNGLQSTKTTTSTTTTTTITEEDWVFDVNQPIAPFLQQLGYAVGAGSHATTGGSVVSIDGQQTVGSGGELFESAKCAATLITPQQIQQMQKMNKQGGSADSSQQDSFISLMLKQLEQSVVKQDKYFGGKNTPNNSQKQGKNHQSANTTTNVQGIFVTRTGGKNEESNKISALFHGNHNGVSVSSSGDQGETLLSARGGGLSKDDKQQNNSAAQQHKPWMVKASHTLKQRESPIDFISRFFNLRSEGGLDKDHHLVEDSDDVSEPQTTSNQSQQQPQNKKQSGVSQNQQKVGKNVGKHEKVTKNATKEETSRDLNRKRDTDFKGGYLNFEETCPELSKTILEFKLAENSTLASSEDTDQRDSENSFDYERTPEVFHDPKVALMLCEKPKRQKPAQKEQIYKNGQQKSKIQQQSVMEQLQERDQIKRHGIKCLHEPKPDSISKVDPQDKTARLFATSHPSCIFVANQFLWANRFENVTKIIGNNKKSRKRSDTSAFCLLLEVNRCLLTMSMVHYQSLKSQRRNCQFQANLLNICEAHPWESLPDADQKAHQKMIDEFQSLLRKGCDGSEQKRHDFGLSQKEERNALIFAIIRLIHQIRGQMYFKIFKTTICFKQNDIECAYFMPEEEDDDQILPLLTFSEQRHQLLRNFQEFGGRWKGKVVRAIEDGLALFQRTATQIVSLGIMRRIFPDSSIFAGLTRIGLSNGICRSMLSKVDECQEQTIPEIRSENQKKVQGKYDIFGDKVFGFGQDLSEQSLFGRCQELDCLSDVDDFDSEKAFTEETPLFTKGEFPSQTEEYETFLDGFFAFFILQDPIVKLFFDNLKTCSVQDQLANFLNQFEENYQTQWAHIMLELGVFESLGGLQSSNALSYTIAKYYYEDLKRAQSLKPTKVPQNQNISDCKKQEKLIIKTDGKDQNSNSSNTQPNITNTESKNENTKTSSQTTSLAFKPVPAMLKQLALRSSTFKWKFVEGISPLRPLDKLSLQTLQDVTMKFLCTHCCSHWIGEEPQHPGEVYIEQIYKSDDPQVDMPCLQDAKKSSQQNKVGVGRNSTTFSNQTAPLLFPIHSFTCFCKRKTLVCETSESQSVLPPSQNLDLFPDLDASQRPLKTSLTEEMAFLYGKSLQYSHSGIICRNQRIIQIKTLQEPLRKQQINFGAPKSPRENSFPITLIKKRQTLDWTSDFQKGCQDSLQKANKVNTESALIDIAGANLINVDQQYSPSNPPPSNHVLDTNEKCFNRILEDSLEQIKLTNNRIQSVLTCLQPGDQIEYSVRETYHDEAQSCDVIIDTTKQATLSAQGGATTVQETQTKVNRTKIASTQSSNDTVAQGGAIDSKSKQTVDNGCGGLDYNDGQFEEDAVTKKRKKNRNKKQRKKEKEAKQALSAALENCNNDQNMTSEEKSLLKKKEIQGQNTINDSNVKGQTNSNGQKQSETVDCSNQEDAPIIDPSDPTEILFCKQLDNFQQFLLSNQILKEQYVMKSSDTTDHQDLSGPNQQTIVQKGCQQKTQNNTSSSLQHQKSSQLQTQQESCSQQNMSRRQKKRELLKMKMSEKKQTTPAAAVNEETIVSKVNQTGQATYDSLREEQIVVGGSASNDDKAISNETTRETQKYAGCIYRRLVPNVDEKWIQSVQRRLKSSTHHSTCKA